MTKQEGFDMKKSASLEENRVRQPRAGRVGKASAPTLATTKTVKLAPARKGEPIGLLEEHFPDSEAHAVSFEYFNPVAREVLVAGSFNDWQPRATPMGKQRGGKWSTELLLKPGRYEYRLVVDGQWQDDPMAARFVANPFGGLNCVVEVKSTATADASQP
jgi:1,4-alpha-glucan branching enzyme